MRQIAIAIVKWNAQFLVGKRSDEVVLAGYWEFPGGKIEPGETPSDAATRETLEETGLSARASETFDVVRHEYDHGQVELHFIRCELTSDPSQVRPPFRWVNPQQLAECQFPAANRAVIDRLLSE